MILPKPLNVCVVCHTHWDREWYHPLPRFRQRLVSLIDSLIGETGQGHPAPSPFLLDGQAITLCDYLHVRPEQHEALRARLQSGELEAGPWYVLADNLIPSGEAILRNLEAGRRVLHRFGATPPRVAYCPDSFGHPAALPSIAAGYGFTVAVVWRGFGGAAHPAVDAFQWVGPDGAVVYGYHLPPDGYEVGSALPATPNAAAQRWQQLLTQITARNHTGVVLLPNGADHHALQPDIAAAITALQHAAAPVATVQRTTLDDFAAQFAHAARASHVPTVHGELRDSYGFTWTLGGTLATRAQQKRRNARLERLLLRDVEPWAAVSWLAHPSVRSRAPSADGSITLAQLPAFLHTAWQELLETHPHDTLCGCSIDAVARAMDIKQESVAAQLRGIRQAALHLRLSHRPVVAREQVVHDDVVVVRNRAAVARAGMATLRLIETLADVRVGPGSGDVMLPKHSASGTVGLPGLVTQPISARVQPLRRESPQHYPDNDLVRVHRVLAWVPEVPAYGLRRFAQACVGEAAPLGATPRVPALHIAETPNGVVMRNDFVCITVQAGMVSIQQAGREISDALSLETITDLGDSYTPSLRGTAERLRCGEVRIVHRGPLRAALRLRWESAARDIRVDTTLSLDAGAQLVRCDVHGTNRKRDHRLQLRWRTGLHEAVTTADAAFGPVRRVVAVAPPHSREAVVPTMPMHRWVAQTTDRDSTVLLADGLAEAASSADALSITLLRAIGELSRHDLPERPGHAGWPASTPNAQSIGRFRATLGFLCVAADSETERLRAIAGAVDELLLPLVGHTMRDLDVANSADILPGVELMGPACEMSAITLAQHHEGVVLRAVNRTASHTRGSWQLPNDGPWMVQRCRLDETPIGVAERCGAVIAFTAAPREIVTLLVTVAPAHAAGAALASPPHG